MIDIVFTGPATDHEGKKVLRDQLKKAAESAGFRVLPAMTRNVQYLIASRTDTVKAGWAKVNGTTVVDYPTFIDILRKLGVDPLKYDGKVHPIVDTMPAQTVTEDKEPGVTYL
jgi:uncharacterized protein YutE (UPF0331/DUF86 family)